jgi:hypothetical protein
MSFTEVAMQGVSNRAREARVGASQNLLSTNGLNFSVSF